MKTYIVYNVWYEQFDILYCGTDKQKAFDIKNKHERPHDNYLEVWKDGKRIA